MMPFSKVTQLGRKYYRFFKAACSFKMQEAGGNRPLALRGFGLGNVFNQEKKGIINSSYTVSNIFTKQDYIALLNTNF